MKALRLGLSSLMRCLLQTALRSSPARYRDRRYGPEAKGNSRIFGAGLRWDHCGVAGAVLAGAGGSGGGGAAALGTAGGASVIIATAAATGAAGWGLLGGSI